MSERAEKSLYVSMEYRRILRARVEAKRRIDPGCTYEKLAQAMRVQKSYLSRVIKEDAHLSADQLYLGARFLGLKEEEVDYLELLLEHERCAVAERKGALLARIRKIQAKKAQTAEQVSGLGRKNSAVDMSRFYLDATHQLVHIALTIPRYQSDLGRIAIQFGLTRKKVLRSVRLLEELELVEARKDGRWIAKVQKVHLPPDSPHFQGWRTQLRLLSMNRLQTLDSDEAYSFSVVFSATEEARNKIRFRFLEMLKEIQGEVEKAAPERCFQMNFDLLPWDRD